MENLHAIVLAAGRGTRMLSAAPKVMHRLLGEPLLSYPLRVLAELSLKRRLVVVGADDVGDRVVAAFAGVPGLSWPRQEQAHGTADAVAAAMPALVGIQGCVLILCGDVPLLQTETLRRFYARHRASGADLSVLTAVLPDGGAYGRVLLDENGAPQKIVEARDAAPEVLAGGRVNSGTYLVDLELLRQALARIDCVNAQGEYYLTDMVAFARAQGRTTSCYDLEDAREMLGVNNRQDLVEIEELLLERTNRSWLDRGVTIRSLRSVRIGPLVELAEDVEIEPGVSVLGRCRIGRGSRIGTGAQLQDCELGEQVEVKPYTVIEDAVIGAAVQLGPFARIRPGTRVADEVKIGNFVETKKAYFGRGAKASHLSYIGDAEVGEGSNLGAGTITCNYDGFSKFKTEIGRRVFIGSDCQLVAPVCIGDDALVGAGSTITRPVSANALVTSRTRQKELPGRGMAGRGPAKED